MNGLDLVLRWLHILSAMALVGGAFFWKFVWSPASSAIEADTKEQVFEPMRKRWSVMVSVGTLLLLVTGLWNAVRIIQRYDFPNAAVSYHILVAIKLVLALLVFYLAARLTGSSENAKRFRANPMNITIHVVLVTIVVCLAGYMKMTPRVEKQDVLAVDTAATESTTPETLDAP